MTKPNGIGRLDLWSQPESVLAAEIWQQQFADIYGEEQGPRGTRERVWRSIATEIGRTRDAVADRYMRYGARFGSMKPASPRQAPAELVAERARRAAAADRMSLTSTFFGDPPPGFSALDRRSQ